MPDPNPSAPDAPAVFVPVARGRALTRGAMTVCLAALGALVFRAMVDDLNFVPSGVSNRIEDYAMAAAAAPVGIATLVTAGWGLAWWGVAVWPGRLGVHARPDTLELGFGPFGHATYDADRLRVQYPYELSADDAQEAQFEAFMPIEQQRAQLLPELSHPDARRSIRRRLLKFCQGDEAQMARRLRPMLDAWRGDPPHAP